MRPPPPPCASPAIPTRGAPPSHAQIAIGVVNHSTAAVEPPEVVAGIVRKALEYVPPERLILSSDCGFGREGLSRRVAFFKAVAVNLGANIVRWELKLPEVEIPAADRRFMFAG